MAKLHISDRGFRVLCGRSVRAESRRVEPQNVPKVRPAELCQACARVATKQS